MAAVWTSTDGVTWSRVPPQPEILGGPDYQAMDTVYVGGPGLVAVGESSPQRLTVWTSTDGTTWFRLDTATRRGRDEVTVLQFYAFGRA